MVKDKTVNHTVRAQVKTMNTVKYQSTVCIRMCQHETFFECMTPFGEMA